MQHDYPLFPLPLVAFPGCRLPLQIFEPRYLDLVKYSLSNDESFGVVTTLPNAGDSSDGPGEQGDIHSIGTMVRIVDFNEQPNGLLGIVCEGQQKFTVLDTRRSDNNLVLATIDTLSAEPTLAVPAEFEELVHVLHSLLEHPYVANLGYSEQSTEVWLADAARMSFHLAYLLPFPNAQRYELLALVQPLERLAKIQAILDQMNE